MGDHMNEFVVVVLGSFYATVYKHRRKNPFAQNKKSGNPVTVTRLFLLGYIFIHPICSIHRQIEYNSKILMTQPKACFLLLLIN